MSSTLPPPAYNGLLDRRLFLQGLIGTAVASASCVTGATSLPESMRIPGTRPARYGSPAPEEQERVQRIAIPPELNGGVTLRTLHFTPLDKLRGTYTPSGLHFQLSHQGVPNIRASNHSLTIHGLVKRALKFDLDALERYSMVDRSHFLECSGNTTSSWQAPAANLPLAISHGLLSGTQWTGVPLGILLEEAGLQDGAAWVVAEGADAGSVSRSIPLKKAMNDSLLALYQNGERLRPEQGYPLRLFNPGYEGNSNIKWLRSLRVTAAPGMTRFETSRYTDLLPDGRAYQFSLEMDVKSVITHPSNASQLDRPGIYEVSGLAWSGDGRIERVEVTADGGKSWAPALLEPPVLPRMLTRFRIPLEWRGQPVILGSRAISERGAMQPSRDSLIERRGTNSFYHYNGIHFWQIGNNGAVVQHAG